MARYLRLIRPLTTTTVTVECPILLDCMQLSEKVVHHLHGWVDFNYAGFEICDFLTDDQKKMMEIDLTQ